MGEFDHPTLDEMETRYLALLEERRKKKAERPQNKHLKPGLNEQAQKALGVTPLGAAERSTTYRVRASTAASDWFAAMNAGERGELIDQLYRAQQKT